MEDGYFFCGDVLGFKEIVMNLDSETLNKRINEWILLIEEVAKNNNIEKYQLISDSIFAALDSNEDPTKLIKFARDLLERGVSKSFPVRGAICYGDFSWGKVVYGKAVIEAYKYEQKQNWIGILVDNICADRFASNTTNTASIGLVTYPVPMRQEKIMLFQTISWKVPTFEELAKYLTCGGLGGQPGFGKVLDWDWGEKIGNTVIYGLYLMALEKNGKSREKFCGMHPVHFIDKALRMNVENA